ncbi:MAG TPA: cyclic nucleotide-binding domain-containing protein [Candidatus Limnocylindrales bacterium]|nr:cyclic nucleotide-binding domain-containing protein [Candidatus Limnocylindrales bacterium]
MTLTADRRAELISGCRLFSGLEAGDLAAVAAAAIEVDFPADRVIAREGEIGTGFFIVVDGRVRVTRSGTVVAHLGPGEFFGELSVLDGGPRVAQVVAEAPTRCLALASWDFERVLREEPGVALAVLRVVAARLRAVTTDHRT